jgi:hypothetical protein
MAAAAPAAASTASSAGALNWATLMASIGNSSMQGMAGKAGAKAEKRKAKEMKRHTYAELLNQALQRQADLHRSSQQTQQEGALNRAKLMQDTASQFRQSFV